MHIDTMSIELSVLYFKGSAGQNFYRFPADCFYLSKLCGISSGSSLFVYMYPWVKVQNFLNPELSKLQS